MLELDNTMPYEASVGCPAGFSSMPLCATIAAGSLSEANNTYINGYSVTTMMNSINTTLNEMCIRDRCNLLAQLLQ